MVDGQAGKGSKYRSVNQKKYYKNWEKAFSKNAKNKSTTTTPKKKKGNS